MRIMTGLALAFVLFSSTWACADPVPAVNACRNYYQLMPVAMKNYLLTLVSDAKDSGFEQYTSGSFVVQAVKIDEHTIHMKFFEYGQTTMASCIELVRY